MGTEPSGNPALDTAREQQGDVVVLSTGVRARIRAVSAALIDSVTARIPDPPVPMWRNPQKDRDEPNPADPSYLQAVAQAQRARGLAALDAFILFGLELVDPVPADRHWVEQLRLLEHLGHLDLTEFDLTDPLTLEFLYKKFIACGPEDLRLIAERSSVSQEELARARASFPGGPPRSAD